MKNFSTIDRPSVGETNGLVDGSAYHAERWSTGTPRRVYWTAPCLTITRLRLLSDPGFPVWDVSYCHGMIGKEFVTVTLPFSQLPKGAVSTTIIKHAIRDGLYVKETGIFNAISKLC